MNSKPDVSILSNLSEKQKMIEKVYQRVLIAVKNDIFLVILLLISFNEFFDQTQSNIQPTIAITTLFFVFCLISDLLMEYSKKRKLFTQESSDKNNALKNNQIAE